eukprot:TRINITY_DN29963_c0_g1_i1.p1 TRINITY_DN29963_c0_g1~~TRINITY_DN29963_c0_g1_i1.p1  ORF type:complete len:443 (+),score=118.46 TRINITY_DN29963_c0_g1_i1:119-1447(+)
MAMRLGKRGALQTASPKDTWATRNSASPAASPCGSPGHSPRFPRAQQGLLKPAKYQGRVSGASPKVPRCGTGGSAPAQASSGTSYVPTSGASSAGVRLIDPATGEYTFSIKGRSAVYTALTAPYHYVVSLKWWKLICLSLCMFFVLNVAFATAYYSPCVLGDTHMGLVSDAAPKECSFVDAFEFSVETLATIGFGEVRPGAGWSRAIVSVEAWMSMLLLPFLASIVFQKIYAVRKLRHTLVFTQSAVVKTVPDGGFRMFEFRLASLMKHPPGDTEVSVYLLRDHRADAAYRACGAGQADLSVTPLAWRPSYSEDGFKTGWQPLPVPYLAVPALVQHPIDAASPLRGITYESLKASRWEVVVVARAVDPSTQNAIHVKTTYNASNIVFDAAFDRDLVTYDVATGRYDVNLTHFDSVLPELTGVLDDDALGHSVLSTEEHPLQM